MSMNFFYTYRFICNQIQNIDFYITGILFYSYSYLFLFIFFQILHQDLNHFLYIILITLDPFCRLFFKIILYQNLNTFLYIITIFLLKYIKAFCILLQYLKNQIKILIPFCILLQYLKNQIKILKPSVYYYNIFIKKLDQDITLFCILLQCFYKKLYQDLNTFLYII